MAKKQVLVLFAHPNLYKSRVNGAMLRAIQRMENVVINDLYETYPDFHIDVAREQDLLLKADTVVLHHPIYWYSCPPLMKQWLDDVLEVGFAYGPGGDKLRGKTLQLAVSAGGPDYAYAREGYHFYTIEELLRPFEQTARLCSMNFARPFVAHGANALSESEINAHAMKYRELLGDLCEGCTK